MTTDAPDTPLHLHIERLGFRGAGIGVAVDSERDDTTRPTAWRVAGALPGERVVARPVEREWGPPTAFLERIVAASPDRIDADCAQDHHCPGCQLRHLADEKRLDHVVGGWQRRIARALGVSYETIAAHMEAVRRTAARNGFRYHAHARLTEDGAPTMRPLLGAPVDGIDLRRCPVQADDVQRMLALVADVVAAHGDRDDLPAAVTIERSPVTGHGGRVTLHAYDPDATDGSRLVASDVAARAPGQGVVLELGDPTAPGPYRPRHLPLVEPFDLAVAPVDDDGGPLLFAPPGAWASPTPHGARVVGGVLRDVVDEIRGGARDASTADASNPACDEAEERRLDGVIELGCGVGAHAFALADRATRYHGVDQSRAAIRGAEANAARLGRDGLAFRVGRADRALKRLVVAGVRAELVVIHPMRTGMGDDVGRYLGPAGAHTVVHVTPTARALATDAKVLAAHDYVLRQIIPIDTMPGTYHMMAVAIFTR